MVKNITDYGAFIDLGGIDGLLHVTDMAWRRVAHPSEIVTVGDTVKVQIIRINSETQRISLGMKQLEADPWDGIAAKYPVGSRLKGTVTNITDYGAFVELEPGVEGLIHVSEMSWTKKNIHPGKIISTSQEVEVQVLEVDPDKRRISLGLKQTQENPWTAFTASHPPGTNIEGPIRNITEFGLFVGLDGGIDGMVHLSDLDWTKSGEDALKDFNKGDMVKAVVLEADSEKERISLGIKQLTADPFASGASSTKLKKGMRVTCEVLAVKDNGLEAKLLDSDLTTFIRRSDLSRDRSEQRPDRFGVGEKFDAVVTQVDAKARKSRSRSKRSRSPMRRRPWRNTARPILARRLATSSALPSAGPRKTAMRRSRKSPSARAAPRPTRSRPRTIPRNEQKPGEPGLTVSRPSF